VNLSAEVIRRGLVSKLSAAGAKPKPECVGVGYWRWELAGSQEGLAWRQGMWMPEDEDGEESDAGGDVEVATALAVSPEAVYVGTYDGQVLEWSREGHPEKRMRVGQGPVWNLCMDGGGLRAAQCGDTAICFQQGAMSGKSRHAGQRPSVVALEEGLVLWTGPEMWTVDGWGVVRWAARFAKPIVGCVAAAGGFTVVAGSCLYRFGGVGIEGCLRRSRADRRKGP
jgi:hypothetical protein